MCCRTESAVRQFGNERYRGINLYIYFLHDLHDVAHDLEIRYEKERGENMGPGFLDILVIC
jgi:hypothetical protein